MKRIIAICIMLLAGAASVLAITSPYVYISGPLPLPVTSSNQYTPIPYYTFVPQFTQVPMATTQAVSVTDFPVQFTQVPAATAQVVINNSPTPNINVSAIILNQIVPTPDITKVASASSALALVAATPTVAVMNWQQNIPTPVALYDVVTITGDLVALTNSNGHAATISFTYPWSRVSYNVDFNVAKPFTAASTPTINFCPTNGLLQFLRFQADSISNPPNTGSAGHSGDFGNYFSVNGSASTVNALKLGFSFMGVTPTTTVRAVTVIVVGTGQ